jgi:HD-GYP domain-containing protein (c-di-GMP phosphodiesterase class II)
MARTLDQIELMMEFSAILNSTHTTSEVREKAMALTCKLMSCEGATLYLADLEKQELFFEAIVGPVSRQTLKEIRLPIGAGSIAGSVAKSQTGILVNDVSQDNRHSKTMDTQAQYQTRNMAVAPVIAKGELIGVLQAINRCEGTFCDRDLHLLKILSHQVAIAIENARLLESLHTVFIETVSSLASAIDAKDPYTGGHTKRVAFFSQLIARYMGFSKDEVEKVKIAALLHDIGKIGIDDKVLKKQAPLVDEEWEHMKDHPDKGYRILAHLKQLKYATDGMRYHHERPDGNGYPFGLKGDEIPMIARIISVADTFDAMTSNRPYRKGLSYEIAFEEIVRHRGTQFDEKVVDAFINAFKMERMGKKRISAQNSA